jgi:hypothetical protein
MQNKKIWQTKIKSDNKMFTELFSFSSFYGGSEEIILQFKNVIIASVQYVTRTPFINHIILNYV